MQRIRPNTLNIHNVNNYHLDFETNFYGEIMLFKRKSSLIVALIDSASFFPMETNFNYILNRF